MENDKDQQIDQLKIRLELLARKQNAVAKEIDELRSELREMSDAVLHEEPEIIQTQTADSEMTVSAPANRMEKPHIPQQVQQQRVNVNPSKAKTIKASFDWEKFIGENLANKIGIAITILGVAIGVKYSIEHQLLSPALRVAMGYLFGLVLLGVGFGLKKKYSNFSAVLVSGAMAIMYFMTYAGFSFYTLFSQPVAFGLMLVFTVATVFLAIKYNLQLIAHIGLVGAYAVPFLLSTGSGKIEILFTYMTIINAGILTLAIVKYWKPLYYVSFALSWLIILLWFDASYDASKYATMTMIFSSVFFATFYLIALVYKLIRKEKFDAGDVIIILSNSFIFYGIMYSVLSGTPRGENILGLFTLFNAFIHAVVSFTIYKQKLADRNLFYLIVGLVLSFVTLAIPVQLDGYRVTVLWASEAVVLFWIGRTRQTRFYEKLSYPLMILSFISIIQDWNMIAYTTNASTNIIPVFNVDFLSVFLVILAFVAINVIQYRNKVTEPLFRATLFNDLSRILAPAFLLIILYFSFRVEIDRYWTHIYNLTEKQIAVAGESYTDSIYNKGIDQLKHVWIINYSLFFFSVLSLVNMLKLKQKSLGAINLLLNGIAIVVFLTAGLYLCSLLRDTYIKGDSHYAVSDWNIYIRYVSYAFILPLVVISKIYANQSFLELKSPKLQMFFELLFHLSMLWIASSELIAQLDMHGFAENYKIGLSVLWGVYALLLVVLGMWQKRKYLRWASIVLFAVTLIKLVAYDISHMNTISKTIILVSLGVLLLFISFLYNKYRKYIFGNSAEE